MYALFNIMASVDEQLILQVIAAVLTLLLAVSEYLPFSGCEYNGITQALTLTFKKPVEPPLPINPNPSPNPNPEPQP